MKKTAGRLLLISTAALTAACATDEPTAPVREPEVAAQFAAVANGSPLDVLRAVTGRYQNLKAARGDGFVLLHPCENRPGEGPVGAVYVNFERLLDGAIDPNLPDALIYQPTRNGGEKLVGVEFAVPYALWPQQTPPQFMGATFQNEDEFGVYALHVWLWLKNPNGMFEEVNPRVTCN